MASGTRAVGPAWRAEGAAVAAQRPGLWELLLYQHSWERVSTLAACDTTAGQGDGSNASYAMSVWQVSRLPV